MLSLPQGASSVDKSHLFSERRKAFQSKGFDVSTDCALCEIKRVLDEEGKPKQEFAVLCNFIAWINRQIIKNDGSTKRRYFEIGVMVKGQRLLEPIVIPADEFNLMNWPTGRYGAILNMASGPSKKDKARYAINAISTDAPEEMVYMHTGWIEVDGIPVYLNAGGAIGAERIRTELEDEGFGNYILPNHPEDLSEAIKCSFEACEIADKSITYSLLAFYALAPLVEPLRRIGDSPGFVLWIEGESGSRKTTIVTLFQNHFGNFPRGRPLPASFNDTENAMTKKLYMGKDSIVPVEDYYPATVHKEAQKLSQKVDALLRTQGNKQGKSRMNADTSLKKTYDPRGLSIVTGEDIPQLAESALARMMPLHISRDSVDLDKLTEMQEKSGRLSHSMSGFISWIAERFNDIGKQVYDEFLAYQRLLQSKRSHGRTIEQAAWLQAGISTFTRFAVDSGAMTVFERSEILEESIGIFSELLSLQTEQLKNENPATQFMDGLREMFRTQRVYVSSIHTPSELGDGEKIGFHDDHYVYLFPISAYTAVFQLYEKQRRKLPLTPTALWKYLDGEKLIEVEHEGGKRRRTIQKRIGGEKHRFVVFSKAVLQDITQLRVVKPDGNDKVSDAGA
jgi:hypothetical protein